MNKSIFSIMLALVLVFTSMSLVSSADNMNVSSYIPTNLYATQPIPITCNATSTLNLTEVTLIIDNVIFVSRNISENVTTHTSTFSVSDIDSGYHSFVCEYETNQTAEFSTIEFFMLDMSSPTMSITNILKATNNLNVEVQNSINDFNLEQCAYKTSDNDTWTTFFCGSPFTAVFSSYGNKTITLMANDTLGNTKMINSEVIQLIDLLPPQYSVISPIANNDIYESNITFQVETNEDAICKYVIKPYGNPIVMNHSEDGKEHNAEYILSRTTNIDFFCEDVSGNVAQETTIEVKILNSVNSNSTFTSQIVTDNYQSGKNIVMVETRNQNGVLVSPDNIDLQVIGVINYTIGDTFTEGIGKRSIELFLPELEYDKVELKLIINNNGELTYVTDTFNFNRKVAVSGVSDVVMDFKYFIGNGSSLIYIIVGLVLLAGVVVIIFKNTSQKTKKPQSIVRSYQND